MVNLVVGPTMTKSWGIILLSLWLILYGVLAVTNIEVQFANLIMGVLSIAAAIALLFGK